jgi:hypothetical protein
MTKSAATRDLVRILVITVSENKPLAEEFSQLVQDTMKIKKIVRCTTWRALTSLKCTICKKLCANRAA